VEVGGPGSLSQSIEACRIGGHIALIGVLTGASGTIPTATLMRRQQTLQGLIVGSRRHQIDMVRAIDATALKPVIDCTFPLEEIAGAFRHQEAGKHFGNICLSI
jgi:NADPH:quinone reductase-like Zn-dependent oxidoreductase